MVNDFFRVMCIKIFRKSALAVECFILCFLRSAQEKDISVFFLVHWPLPFCARQILQELGSHFSSIDVLLSKNDVLFCWKRRVVLLKVTCRFIENDGLFFSDGGLVIFQLCKVARKMECWIVKISTTTISRACVYAHASQEFYRFCCHKCHRVICNSL